MEHCISCKKECAGYHKCSICDEPCHAIAPCCEPDDNIDKEGAGLICRQCSDQKKNSTARRAFASLFKQPGKEKDSPLPPKRRKHGHENTQIGFCLRCFRKNRKQFWLSRFNKSSVAVHTRSVHKGDLTIDDDVVSEKSPRAKDALEKYKQMMAETGENPTTATASKHQLKESIPSSSSETMSPPQSSTQLADPSHDVVGTPPQCTVTNINQSTMALVSADSQDLDKLAEKIAKKVQKFMSHTKNRVSSVENPVSSKAKNLTEFLDEFKDFEVESHSDCHVLQCRSCKDYICAIPSALSSAGPSGSKHGSIAKGLTINEEDFSKLENGHNETWYHQKARLLLHLTSDIHHRSLIHNRKVSSVISNRKRIVINQLRTAIGIIKSKSSALQYEERIAELYAAGAAVGNLGHSRKLFPDMAAVAVAYIRQKCAEFLSTPLPSTGFPPHFYVTADKSTNHRETNQITLVCPVVNGERQGIVASVDRIYVTSDGVGGGAAELATTLLAGVASLKFSPDLLQMQGKVLDGQYLNNRFINTINEAILSPFDLTNSIVSEEVWWPFQWDPSHWLDKVFSKFKGCAFVDRILKRSNLYHQLFGHGKMHSIVTAMSREQSRPIKVTSAFAHQRFLSSSYLSLKNLQESLEIYIDAFKDHDNREEMGYKIYGVDFVTDLLGLLDLLKPITIVMTQVQAHWCPGWKLHSFVPCVIQQLKKFKSSLQNESDRLSDACPLLSQHLPKLDSMKYGDCELVEGWLIVGEVKPGMPVRWEARDRKDCFRDLRDLANGMLMELETRFAKCCPPLLKLLSQCLDFETIVKQLCGERIDGNQPVNRRKLAAAGLKEFTKCVEFICELPHIKDANLDIGPEFASAIFWGIKSTLLEVIWGDLFEKYFSLFFVKWNPNCTKTAAVPVHNATIRIRKFMPVTSDSFSLFAPFEVVLESGREFVVRLDEKRLINSLYTDPQFFGAVGREFCVVFDVMYAKTGTEAIAESFYRVMEKQQMDGGQSFEVLKNRTIVDWSLPHTVQCDDALSQMASMYIYGAKEHGIKKHYVSVSNSRPSKVVSRLMRDVPNLPFLV